MFACLVEYELFYWRGSSVFGMLFTSCQTFLSNDYFPKSIVMSLLGKHIQNASFDLGLCNYDFMLVFRQASKSAGLRPFNFDTGAESLMKQSNSKSDKRGGGAPFNVVALSATVQCS